MSAVHDVHVSNRAWIVDLARGLDDAGWARPTLCEGWDVEDLVAHLVARERHPIAAAGIVVPALHSMHERAMATEAAKGRGALLERLASGPPLGRMPVVANLVDWANALEFWIHAEDVARGGLAIERAAPDGATAATLWRILTRTARFNFRSVHTAGTLAIADTTTGRSVAYRLGGRLARAADPANADVTLSGTVGELTLWISGRRDAARVDLAPPAHPLAIDLQTARLGV